MNPPFARALLPSTRGKAVGRAVHYVQPIAGVSDGAGVLGGIDTVDDSAITEHGIADISPIREANRVLKSIGSANISRIFYFNGSVNIQRVCHLSNEARFTGSQQTDGD